jgi:hypothetical protein
MKPKPRYFMKTDTVGMTVTIEERIMIRTAAAMNNKSMSGYARDLVLDHARRDLRRGLMPDKGLAEPDLGSRRPRPQLSE